MTVRSDFYQIVLRFPRLFPDPAVFEDPIHLANRYLMGNGIPREKADLVHQTTDEIVPVDDRGNPSTASGTAKYLFEGRTIQAEYMINANIRLDYADFGTGLTPDDHSRLWTKGKLRTEIRAPRVQASGPDSQHSGCIRALQDLEGACYSEYAVDHRTGQCSGTDVQSRARVHRKKIESRLENGWSRGRGLCGSGPLRIREGGSGAAADS